MQAYNNKKDEKRDQDIERCIEQYGESIWRMCYMYLKDKHLAEDAMQDCFIKAYAHYEKFENRSSEKTWLMRIAINTCKNYLKTAWFKRVIIGVKSDSRRELGTEEEILIKEQEEELFKNIMALKQNYKDVILLYYYQEMQVREIAEVLGISQENVSMRLKRGRMALKNILEEEKENG